nr:hypothetical protein [Tanacetum cinerariifolium]
MEILLEPTSNKLMISITKAGNPVKKILLKLNLSDHRIGTAHEKFGFDLKPLWPAISCFVQDGSADSDGK